MSTFLRTRRGRDGEKGMTVMNVTKKKRRGWEKRNQKTRDRGQGMGGAEPLPDDERKIKQGNNSKNTTYIGKW
ncbi:hypothetical protein M407DRAFT_166458 [Tulasnella calospora MUT 4182]|uniref:Uncharacterized protein n=1 Tax=Tulasnella calospora MUT 4182 TaxID=1051891 RepID=A0A0C3QW77_9AGAM|nr:hypothetical protein M407DRAFT_166458 [Tulasnella calospora MUT 4182]